VLVRRKPNKSGLVSIQVIDKTSGRYRVVKTIGSSKDTKEIERLELEAKQFVQEYTGIQVLDFTDNKKYFEIEREDKIRKTGFSKDGKHQQP
jgi:hypothetical protein